MKIPADGATAHTGGDASPMRPQRRERSGVSRMIGRWPEGLHFEDAAVPREAWFRGAARDAPGVWPSASLEVEARIARGR